jgi:hypothetical protein
VAGAKDAAGDHTVNKSVTDWAMCHPLGDRAKIEICYRVGHAHGPSGNRSVTGWAIRVPYSLIVSYLSLKGGYRVGGEVGWLWKGK